MVTCNSLPPPWTAAHQAPLSAGLPRQEDWSELPFPSPGDLPNSGIELVSPALAGAFFTAELPGKPFEIICSIKIFGASLVAQNSLVVKNLPAMWETEIQSLGWENLLKKGMTTYSSILAWRIPWTEEPGGLQSMGSQRVRHKLISYPWLRLCF